MGSTCEVEVQQDRLLWSLSYVPVFECFSRFRVLFSFSRLEESFFFFFATSLFEFEHDDYVLSDLETWLKT